MSLTSDSSAVERAASEWAVKLAAGPLTGSEEAAFTAWLAENPSHGEHLRSFQRIYFRLGEAVPRLAAAGVLAEAPCVSSRSPDRVARPRRWTAPAGAAVAAMMVIGFSFWWSARPESLSTPSAQRQTHTLADGSRVDLNALTDVAVKQGEDRREVWLRSGEAYFDVAPDAKRPFWVHTPAGSVRVVGTKFNVRSNGTGQIEVTVASGRVEVAPGSGGRNAHSAYALGANDQLAFDGDRAALRQLAPEAVGDAMAWREGWVVFDHELLGSAVRRFAAYHGRRVEIAPEAARLEIGGRFKLDEFDQFLRDLEHTLPVTVLQAGERCRIALRAGTL